MRRYILIGLWLLLIVGVVYAAYWIAPGVKAYFDVMAISNGAGLTGDVARKTLEATIWRGLPGIVVAVACGVGLVVARRGNAR